MSAKPWLVGITGGIGAGKSIICRIFEVLGVPVYDADSQAKWLMNHEESLRKEIITLFGKEAFDENGLNRAFLAKQAFGNPALLSQLNAVVHPAVGKDFEAWTNSHATADYVLKEAALLFETGSYQQLSKTILVTAPEAIRIQRVVRRDSHRTAEDVQKIMAQQWPEEKKEKLADFRILNDESELVIPQVLEVHEALLKEIRG